MNHNPDPQFLEHLEWQMESALRRRERFARPVPHVSLRIVRTLALVLMCTLSGAGLVVASEKIQVAREKQLLLERNDVELALSERRVGRAAENMDVAHARYDSGLVGPIEVERARLAFERVAIAQQHLQRDRAEIELSGHPPNSAISAPLLGGRDFFTERLRLEESSTRREVEIIRREFELAEARWRAGLISPGGVEAPRLELQRLERILVGTHTRKLIRTRFVKGALNKREARRADRLNAIDLDSDLAKLDLQSLQQELERVHRRVEVRAATTEDLRAVEERIESAEAVRHLAEYERQLVMERE